MNRTTIILSVSVVALLTASQVAVAGERLKLNTGPNSTITINKPELLNQKPNSPVVNGSTNAVKNGQNGGLSGLGVPGGLNTGSGFKGPNGSSIMPKGASDTVKDGVSGLKLGNGQTKGVESKGTISDRMAPGMIKAIKDDYATKGKELGVQQGDGISAKMAPGMIKAIHDDQDSKGKEKGVQSGDSGYRVTPGQLQQMRDMTVNPKINPNIGMLGDDLKFDPKGDGKSGTGKTPPAPKPGTGAGTPAPKPSTGTTTPKPAAPKPSTGTAGTKPAPKKDGKSGGTVVVVNPKGDGTKGGKKTGGATVTNGGKTIVFPDQKISARPKPNPMEKIIPKPPKPPKLELSNNPAMDRLQ